MMACHDCGANLDAVLVGDPCPECGSTRRDAMVGAATIEATATIHPATIVVASGTAATGHGYNKAEGVVLSPQAQRRVEDLAVGTTVRSVVFHDPGEDGFVVCEARDEDGNLLDAKLSGALMLSLI